MKNDVSGVGSVVKSEHPSEFLLSKAGLRDLPEIFRLTSDCVSHMRSQGIDQWDELYPNEEVIRGDIEGEALYILRDEGQIVGCFTLDNKEDPLWSKMDWAVSAPSVGAIHRLMIAPSQQGRGLSKRLMGQAEALAQEQGFGAIHLDCFTANPAALRLYEAMGYRRTGVAQMRKGSFVCFEKLL